MKLKRTRVEPALLEVLKDEHLDGFTILELRDLYAERVGFGQCENGSELRKWLYRRMLHLVNKELFTKIQDESNQTARYFKTESFVKMFILPESINPVRPTSVKSSSDEASLAHAQERLNQYQVDMYAYAGECLEYQQLITEYPQLRSDIEQMHQAAKQKSSELLGQIRAINNILQRTTAS